MNDGFIMEDLGYTWLRTPCFYITTTTTYTIKVIVRIWDPYSLQDNEDSPTTAIDRDGLIFLQDNEDSPITATDRDGLHFLQDNED